MGNKASVVMIVLLLMWLCIRLIVAERVSEPAYVLVAGNNYIQQQWNHCSRFDSKPNSSTLVGRTLNYLNSTGFKLCRPVFWLENKLLGRRIEKGTPSYGTFTKRLSEIRVTNWDYVVFSKKDGSALLVVKNRAIVQTIE